MLLPDIYLHQLAIKHILVHMTSTTGDVLRDFGRRFLGLHCACQQILSFYRFIINTYLQILENPITAFLFFLNMLISHLNATL